MKRGMEHRLILFAEKQRDTLLDEGNIGKRKGDRILLRARKGGEVWRKIPYRWRRTRRTRPMVTVAGRTPQPVPSLGI